MSLNERSESSEILTLPTHTNAKHSMHVIKNYDKTSIQKGLKLVMCCCKNNKIGLHLFSLPENVLAPIHIV